MKKGLMKLMLATFVLAIVCTSTTMAQRGQGKPAGDKPSPTERAERMTEKMTKKLELNDYQSDQLANLNLDFANQAGAIRDNDDLEREEKKAAIKSLKENHKTQLAGILDAEQMAKFEKWLEHRKGKKGGKGKGKSQ